MKLDLTEESKDYVRITYNTDHFVVNIGENDPILREYSSVEDMLKEFQENEIGHADFDDVAHRMFQQEINDNPYLAT